MQKLALISLRGRRLAFAVLALALVGGLGLVLGSSQDVSAATKFTVYAGGGRAGIGADIFRPNVINVNEGDTIDFNNPYEELHTVTYLAGEPTPHLIEPVSLPGLRGPPRLKFTDKAAIPVPARGTANVDGSAFQNSGLMAKGATWSVNFKKTGNYQLICVLHPLMTMAVNVLPLGTFVPSQATLDAEAQRQLDSAISRAEAAYSATSVTRTANANGTTTFESPFVNLPTGAVNRFVPARLQIGVGDTVVWKNDKPGAPHTVTFGMPPAPQPGEENPQVLPNFVSYPAKPSQNYDGTAGYVNSGLISLPPEGVGGTSFSLTFTRAGTYSYICILHIDQGMAGVVEVGAGGGSAAGGAAGTGAAIGGAAAGAAGAGSVPSITPPSTGDAGLNDASSMTPWLVAAAAVLVFGLGGIAFAKAKIRS